MKNIYKLGLFVLLAMASCDSFLDVKPAREVTSQDLLAERKGYESALGGLYYNMSKTGLYGTELQYSLIDVLAGYWDITSNQHRFYRLNTYNYNEMESTMTAFWAPMYTIIFNANNIIESLNDKNDLTTHEKWILGEAIGLRAFLHLDLFRLYGPVVKEEGLSVKSLPYRLEGNSVIQPFMLAGDFLNLVIKDLLRAEELLKDDPILTIGGVSNGNPTGAIDYNSLIDRRRNRFNINAATALLARAYQIVDDQEKAKEYALKTLEATDASFVTPTNLNVSYQADTRLTKEIIFGLYIRDHYSTTRTHFGIDGASVNENSSLYVNYDFMQNFVYTEGGDYRRNRWFQNQLSYTVFTRYAEPPVAQDAFLAYAPEVSLISLSEIYLILAESYSKNEPAKSYEYLNLIRENKGIQTKLDENTATTELAISEIVKEARRGYFGEGQLFYLLKRLYLDIDKSANSKVPASLGIYKFPIPKSELDHNN